MFNRKRKIKDIVNSFHASFPFLTGNLLDAFTAMNIYLRRERIPYLVVGSIALRALGVPLKRACHDVDIEVIANERQEQQFKEFAQASGTHLHEQQEQALRGFAHKPYVFYYRGVQINIWVSREKFSHPRTVLINGVAFPTVDSLLRAKATYHRPKDLEDFLYITQTLIGTICGQENLERLMPKINIDEIQKIILNRENDGHGEAR